MDAVAANHNGSSQTRALGRIERPGQNIKAIIYDPRFAVAEVVDALYLKDEAAGVTALNRLKTQVDALDATLDSERREVLGLYALWLNWQMTRAFHFEQRHVRRSELFAELAQPRQSHLGEVMRTKLELQLRCNSEGPDKFNFAPEQFHPLYARIPAGERHSELMYYVAGWAFRHRELAVLEDCFEHFTFHADGASSDYTWQYVNIMYQLLLGKATARDIDEHLKRISFEQELSQFEKYILPEIARQGLCDSALATAIESTRAYLAGLPPHKPEPELPTKRIAGKL